MDAIYRQWQPIRLIPKAPSKIDSTPVVERLACAGIEIGRRTVQRDFLQLPNHVPLEHGDFKPRGWWWRAGAPITWLPGMDREGSDRGASAGRQRRGERAREAHRGSPGLVARIRRDGGSARTEEVTGADARSGGRKSKEVCE